MKNIPLPLDAYELGFIENFKNCVVHKYADFEGRASRGEYWHFMLIYQLIVAIILFICAAISCVTPVSGTTGVSLGLVILFVLSIGFIIPGVAVAVRRLHDVGWSGWPILLALVPFVGIPVVLILMALPGKTVSNRFGAPTGTEIITKQMAHKYGFIDATPSTILTMGLVVTLIVLWILVDWMLAS
nr:DUF805 domain-containing protein [uncultured Veillonella sp.]